MTEKNFDIEKSLEMIYQAPAPTGEFVRALEKQILQEEQRQVEKRQPFPDLQQLFSPRVMRFALTSATVLLLFVMGMLVVRPDRVASALQQLLSYIPGFGYADASEVKIIAGPVSQRQDDVTLTIQQVVAGSEGTFVVIRVSGLPSEQELLADLLAQLPVPPEAFYQWQESYLSLYETDARLILQDGEELADLEGSFQGAPWEGYFTFPVLPEDAERISFAVSRLPGVPADKAPQGWQLELELEAVTEEQVLALPTASPVGVESSENHGLAVHVIDAVYARTETALRMQVDELGSEWLIPQQSMTGELRDDQGNVYAVQYGPNSGWGVDGVFTGTFQPILPGVQSLSLTIPEIFVEIPLEGQVLRMDLGSAPKIGDQIALDQTIMVEGVAIHITSVTIGEQSVPSMDGSPNPLELLTFTFETDPVPVVDGIKLSGIHADTERLGQFSTTMIGARSAGGEPGAGGLVITIGISKDAPMPTGMIELPVTSASATVGPFFANWDVSR